MDGQQQDASLWPADDKWFARNLIRKRAKRLVRSPGMSVTDQDDVEQQLTVDLWQSSRSFDAARGRWHGFASSVVSHAATKIRRNRYAEKRDVRGTTSLNIEVLAPTGESTELAQTITERERGNHFGLDPLPAEIHADLSMDLAQVSASLPPDWQDVISLYSTFNNSDVAQQTGMKPSTLNDLKRKVQQRFKNAGLEDYFQI